MPLIRKRDWEWNMGDKGRNDTVSHFIHNIRNEWEILFYHPWNSIVMGCLWLSVRVSEQRRRLAGYVPSWLDNVNWGVPGAPNVCLPYLPIYSSQLCALLIFTYRVSLAGIVCMSIAMEFGGLLFGVKKCQVTELIKYWQRPLMHFWRGLIKFNYNLKPSHISNFQINRFIIFFESINF